MKTYLLSIVLLLGSAYSLYAQQTFLLTNASKKFDVKIKIAKCDLSDSQYKTCEGAATVQLMRKNQGNIFQTLHLPNMFLEIGDDNKPTANLIELYGDNNSGIIFDDFNFDGSEDLALRNGNDGAYGGPSYNIYLAATSGKFIQNSPLTELASHSLGLFTVDKKAKRLETFDKDGCCYHETTRYAVVNNRPQKVYVYIEDATSSDGSKVKLTTKNLVKGKWQVKTKTALMKDYYKEN